MHMRGVRLQTSPSYPMAAKERESICMSRKSPQSKRQKQGLTFQSIHVVEHRNRLHQHRGSTRSWHGWLKGREGGQENVCENTIAGR
eukprot:3769448-Rhodomonas_salina.1